LERNKDYYVAPLDQLWMTFGTAVHSILENGFREMTGEERGEMNVEQRLTTSFETPYGPVTLSGTPDVVYGGKKIDDWKATKEYQVKKLMAASREGAWNGDDYFIQQNVYRAIWYPEVERMRLVCIVKDWAERSAVKPVEYITVPVGDTEYVKMWVAARLNRFMEVESHPEKLVDCAEKDTWGGKKCAKYCSVRGVCPQIKK
jgi:hypothetical protein